MLECAAHVIDLTSPPAAAAAAALILVPSASLASTHSRLGAYTSRLFCVHLMMFVVVLCLL